MVVTKKVRKPTKKKKRTAKKSQSVLDRIEPMGFDDDEGIKINLYGRSGTGKTTLWSTFPKPILSVIASSGNAGELRSINTKENRKTISQVVLNEPSELQEVTEMQREEEKFKTVVLDHATGLQDLVLKDILGLAEVPVQRSWGMAKQQDWGQCALQMKEYLRLLLMLRCNVVIVAQEREFNTDSEESIIMPYVASALTPSVTGWLNPSCDYICQTFLRQKTIKTEKKIKGKIVVKEKATREVEYCLRTAPDDVYTTKFRMPGGKLPPDIVNPTYAKIKKLIDTGQ